LTALIVFGAGRRAEIWITCGACVLMVSLVRNIFIAIVKYGLSRDPPPQILFPAWEGSSSDSHSNCSSKFIAWEGVLAFCTRQCSLVLALVLVVLLGRSVHVGQFLCVSESGSVEEFGCHPLLNTYQPNTEQTHTCCKITGCNNHFSFSFFFY